MLIEIQLKKLFLFLNQGCRKKEKQTYKVKYRASSHYKFFNLIYKIQSQTFKKKSLKEKQISQIGNYILIDLAPNNKIC